jgi:hypothetical protein
MCTRKKRSLKLRWHWQTRHQTRHQALRRQRLPMAITTDNNNGPNGHHHKQRRWKRLETQTLLEPPSLVSFSLFSSFFKPTNDNYIFYTVYCAAVCVYACHHYHPPPHRHVSLQTTTTTTISNTRWDDKWTQMERGQTRRTGSNDTTRRLGPGMFLFLFFVLFTNDILG